MNEKPKNPSRTFRRGILILAASLLLSGCLLKQKILTDVYSAIFGVPSGTEWILFVLAFGSNSSYCYGSTIQFSGKLTQSTPGPTQISVKARVKDAADTVLSEQEFSLNANATKKGSTIPNQKFDLLPTCVNSGEVLEVSVTPSGGDIEQNAQLKTVVQLK